MFQLLISPATRNLSLLFCSQIIAQLGDRIFLLALVALLAEMNPGSTTGLAKVMVFTLLPIFFIQPVAGVLVDRWDHRRTLLYSDVIRMIVIFVIPFVLLSTGSMPLIYLAVFVMYSFHRFYIPAKMAFIPDLVAEEDLVKANSLMSVTGMIAAALGAGAAILVEYMGAHNSFMTVGAAYALSALFLFFIHGHHLNPTKTAHLNAVKEDIIRASRAIWKEFKEGFAYIAAQPKLRFIIEVMCILAAAAGAMYVVVIVFVQEAFQSVTKDLGILAISTVAGLFVSVVLFGKYGRKVSWHTAIFVCLILAGMILAAFAYIIQIVPNIYLAMAITFIWGLSLGPIIVACNTIVHLVSEETKRGQVFSALEIFTHVAFLIVMLLSAWLAERIPRFTILMAAGLLVAALGVWGLNRRRDVE